ncbi:hypothetical protein N7414_24765 [Pseudomonas sp. GD04087]|uniref:hypothetical protein n=1 Tax=unclassified Pseudomonas TaxID=196821 RepID=UPI002448E7E9|nr:MULTISPECIES: hypothetical protein [unclassified Pseudomonas]MDH0292347.1 hypothetical protein [Pseudomonas sp. GD04087]MDH1048815.1 hypothetical protein [Pseudomonas sp. GD03903]MDH2001317.1 hypothetical protein [Pseudomonas sp. GD03691]
MKVFLLLGLFGFCVMFIDAAGEEIRKKIPISVFGSREEAAAFATKVESALKDESVGFEEAKRLQLEYSERVVPRYRLLFWGQVAAYALVVLTAMLLYLRSTPKRANTESA